MELLHHMLMNFTKWLRSAATTALVVPNTVHSTIGDRSFPVAAARVWKSSAADDIITIADSFSAASQDVSVYPVI